ncbi:nitrogenase component 1 [Heliophilum fasciatum]|uniref:Nitrogenase molybdenum-iron protein alpha chain n=1 Tax=Heliophilum fasciatum TaxID=35700 RepID=A0A4R2RYH2_9FIRM|nr:nitrogenase component 1 [Heliophilum fasciatum]MCW2277704.1 nitrogenase molybdenum-iron protein alpha chain [Heliophilum fasciatum]TCP65051.1 nitrogenase molybdenum-iron protein alpha chain [Heliophilum fasciatum]
MSFFDQKEPPRREERLGACIAMNDTVHNLAKKKSCLHDDGERAFNQGSICLLLPALAILNSIPDSVVLIHGANGCGSSSHSQNANTRSGSFQRTGTGKDALWLSTGLNETDVISGGELKLAPAIREADQRYRPKTIFVVSTCVPGIIGDDIDGVIAEVQPDVSARIVPIHCQGFKTKIWATAYDAVYHGIGRTLLDEPDDAAPEAAQGDAQDAALEAPTGAPQATVQTASPENDQPNRTVNLMNISSMGRVDELELERLLKAIGLDVNFFPVFASPDGMFRMTKAALSISTCPTHDDYILKHLHEKYGVPYQLKHMPIGIENTNQWIRDIAAFFGVSDQAEQLIAREEQELQAALAEFKPLFAGKTVFVSAGEFRALVTAQLLTELGFTVSGIRSFHHDEFAEEEYKKLARQSKDDYVVNIANVQPFEEANLLQKLKPDLFLGHTNGNMTAAKLGIATHVIYNTGLSYVGYKGAYELARRLYRQLRNPAYNANLAKHLRLPYQTEWYQSNPFQYIKTRGGSLHG